MAVGADEKSLSGLLQRLSKESGTSLSLTDIELLANALVPTSSRSSRSMAFLCLSKFTTDVEKAAAETKAQDDEVFDLFRPYIESIFNKPTPKFQEIEHEEDAPGFDPEACVPATCLLASLFPFVPITATNLLNIKLGDAGDPIGILLELAELPSTLQPALAELFVTAADTKPGKDLALLRALDWLKAGVVYEDESRDTGVLCAAALSKIIGREAMETPEQQTGQEGEAPKEAASQEDEERLARKLMTHIENSPGTSPAIQSTIEGLSVLSLRPRMKVVLASSARFLKALVALSPIPERKGGSLPVTPRGSIDGDNEQKIFEAVETRFCYGLTSIFVNLTSRKVVLSDQDRQIAKLQKMVLAANKKPLNENDDDEDYESVEAVNKRVKAVLAAGCINGLSGLVRAESRLVKEGLGLLCRNLLDLQDAISAKELLKLRLEFVRDGGFKVLSAVIRDLLVLATAKPNTTPPPKLTHPSPLPPPNPADIKVLPAFQALAKLVISIDPPILFPPPHQTTSLNALTPLCHLLIHPDSLPIYRFESLMALTNLASIDPSVGGKIVKAELRPLRIEGLFRGSGNETEVSVVTKVEELMLDENELTRRAAVQLICNLCSCQTGYEYFTGEDSPSSRARSRLNILLVMACIDDLPTRSAAGGALAMLTESEKACKYILMGDTENTTSSSPRSAWSRIGDMLDPYEESSHDPETGELIPIISSTPALPNPDLLHRGAIILYNLLTYTLSLQGPDRQKEKAEVTREGLEKKLFGAMKIAKVMGEDVQDAVVGCLRIIRDQL